ncbi:hypothetical protein RJ640_008400 [Escallonia rubra]|uniref:Exocyst subunit Exo70 family protein n=1 Tax=Escallonia rubra TaxID=112253 RepID=A0AA88UEY2_9ASTE|nr:hypothetical protein RJ640_008400 [Escallonia rubra]
MELAQLLGNAVAFQSAERVIQGYPCLPADFKLPGERMIFDRNLHEIDQYFQAVDQIQRLTKSAALLSDYRSQGINLIQLATARLQFEFQAILTRKADIDPTAAAYFSSLSTSCSSGYQSPGTNLNQMDKARHQFEFQVMLTRQTDSNPTSAAYFSSISTSCSSGLRGDDYTDHPALSDKEIYYLRCITERMSSIGSLHYCIEVYCCSRKKFVEKSFRLLGVEKLSTNDVKRLEWEELQKKIKLWTGAARECVRKLFAREREMFEQIFDGLESAQTYDACFVATVKDAAICLFKFAETVSTTRPWMQKLFGILGLYYALSDLLPDLNLIFQSDSSKSIVNQAAGILPQLEELVRGILSDFENGVLHEMSSVPTYAGTVHPFTKYVMEYIFGIVRYKDILSELIVSKPSATLRNECGRTPLELHIIWIIVSLKFNLESKSKIYNDSSLGHLFVMNNIGFIVQKIEESSELGEMIGNDYRKKLSEIMLEAVNSYRRSIWDRVFYCLRDEGLHYGFGFCKGLSKRIVKQRVKSFNITFEEVCRTPSTTWLVPSNLHLCLQAHQSILEELIPAYESFLGQFKRHAEHPAYHVKYSVEDLKNAVMVSSWNASCLSP